MIALLAMVALAPWQDRPLVIRDVTVIAADGSAPRVATLLIADGRIDAIAPPGRRPPRGSLVVDGTGKFLIPGLFDLHTHVSKSRGSSLAMFVVNGVTTVRDMGGDHQELLAWRREIRAGTRTGPRLLIAGPYLESAANAARQHRTPAAEMAEPVERTRVPVGSPEDAVRIIDSLAAIGVDHIKIRTVTNQATYLAMVRAARARGLALVGHAYGLAPELVLEAGQRSVEHASMPVPDSLSAEARLALWRRFAAAGIGMVPTMIVGPASGAQTREQLEAIVADSAGRTSPWRRYLSRYLLIDWAEQAAEQSPQRIAFFRQAMPGARAALREMRQAGIRIMPGTDEAVINIMPGASLHDELALFVSELGMTPAEALEAGTRVAAEFLGMGDSLGTISGGKIADLVLLDHNPLADIRNTRSIAGVILRGRWIDRSGIDGLLAEVATARDLRENDWIR